MEPSIKYAFVSRSSSVCEMKMGSDFSMANRLRLALLLVFLRRLYVCFAPTPKLLILLLVISMRQSVLKKSISFVGLVLMNQGEDFSTTYRDY